MINVGISIEESDNGEDFTYLVVATLETGKRYEIGPFVQRVEAERAHADLADMLTSLGVC